MDEQTEYSMPRYGLMTPLERIRERYLQGRIDSDQMEYEVWRVLDLGIADVSGQTYACYERSYPLPRVFTLA